MKRTTTLLAALTSATLLLAACTSTTSEEPPPTAESSADQGTDDGAGGGNAGGGNDAPPASGEADQATQDYLDCLLDHGVDAIIDGEGNIALGAGDQGSVSAGDSTSASDEAQAECAKAVPEYVAPNYDEQ